MIACGFANCPRQYTSVRSLRNHLRKKHKYFSKISLEPNQDNADGGDEVRSQDGEPADVNDQVDQVDQFDAHDEEQDTEHDLKCKIGEMLLGLRDNHRLTSKSVAVVAQKMAELVELNNDSIKKKVGDYIEGTELGAHDKQALLSLISEDSSVMQHLNALDSQKKLEGFARMELVVVPPTEYVLGHDAKGRPETIQYVSLKDTVRAMLNSQDVRNSLLADHEVLSDRHILNDITDGTHFLQHPLAPKRHSLSIVLYMDEFTLTNPLRAQAKSYNE